MRVKKKNEYLKFFFHFENNSREINVFHTPTISLDMETYEKLNSFYLGKSVNPSTGKINEQKILYDSKDLTTHAIAVGMTGSGKTGLCVTLIEEAAIDGIPAIIIDPKGDMGNLLLTFPDLLPADFKKWISRSDAEQKGLTQEQLAEQTAALWKDGLEKWEQSGERIKRLKDNADFKIFTPGSSAGIPVSILKSFSAPDSEILNESDLFQEMIETTVTSILGLLDIDADPIKSKEYILLANIFNYVWMNGEDLDIEKIIYLIQSPPFKKVGVLNIDVFYPQKERIDLAMAINNLIASPTFQSWMEGEELDIGKLLYDKQGKPKISIMYISHLSDKERMFFVSLLLNQIIGWMRTQSGSASLRALIYFDEIFGYIPPTANPPSKKPLLTLLKQARAFGLGIVLATQNPVDLDYKGLSNTGTWFIGRLQTDRDRMRMLDGLESSSAAGGGKFDRKKFETIISGLQKRVFLLHNVHESEPVIFHTRWALSYLAGPLTRAQIKLLNNNSGIIHESQEKESTLDNFSSLPILEPGVIQYFLPLRGSVTDETQVKYKPFIFGSADILFKDKNLGENLSKTFRIVSQVNNSAIPIDWNNSAELNVAEEEFETEPARSANYHEVPAKATRLKSYKEWEKDFGDYLYRNKKLTLFKSPSLNLISAADEDERDFRIRASQTARERRDEWVEELRLKYSRKIQSLENKIDRAEIKLEKETEQAKDHKFQTIISIGSTLLGAFMGRKKLSKTTIGKAGTAMRKASGAYREAGDVDRAKNNLDELNTELEILQENFQEEVDSYSNKFDTLNEELETISIYPNKSGIDVKMICLLWIPVFINKTGDEIMPGIK